jgi:hypothetical protein
MTERNNVGGYRGSQGRRIRLTLCGSACLGTGTSITIDWSQARYRDYAFIALDVVPAPPGDTTTMTLRAINQQGVEFDRVVFGRRAAESGRLAPA